LLTEPGGLPVAGEPVELQSQRVGRSGWRNEAAGTTGLGGRVEWVVQPLASTRFRAVHPETPAAGRSISAPREIYVKPEVSAMLKRNWVRPDGAVKLTGQVRPAYEGERVSLQRRVDGRWRTVSRAQQGGQGRFAFQVGGGASFGPRTFRVALEGRDAHLGATTAPMTVTTVRLVTYRIETRGNVRGLLDSFKKRTAEIYADPRGWSRAYVHFKRVRTGGAFSLVLSQAKYVPSFAPICDRYWSCRVGRYVVINENRWRYGTPYFKRVGGTMAEYRAMVTNHETGHWFGLGHATCGGNGQAAPVMMQQSKGLYGCEPNAWPLKWEIARAY